ncbi:MAG: hypothetical protein ACKV2Q_24880 [Planctomycetaceae bacterium]
MAKLVAENDYTDAELLALAREAFAKLLAGECQEYRVGPKVFRKHDLADLDNLIIRLDRRVGTSTTSTSGTGVLRSGVSFARAD